MARKKIVLFILEGTSDEIALEGSLRNIYKPNEIRFCIVRTDITTKNGVTRNNIKNKLIEIIKIELTRFPYKNSDILKVIHLTDMDGAYVDEESIIEDRSCDGFIYSETNIKAKSRVNVIGRNKRKGENLEVLLELNSIYNGLSYNLYYFSCNQEHTLHNIINVEKSKKEELAEKFNDKYEDDFDGFKNFICSKDIKVEGNYRETWEFIKKGNNSLKRFSNLHLLLEEERIV